MLTVQCNHSHIPYIYRKIKKIKNSNTTFIQQQASAMKAGSLVPSNETKLQISNFYIQINHITINKHQHI